jgi:copper homeostasis protein
LKKNKLLEICCYSLQSCLNAEKYGADRIELCLGAEVGGTTPDSDLVGLVLQAVDIPVQVIVRPRGGNFVYSDTEKTLILEHISTLRHQAVSGIVFGALTTNNNIDIQLLTDVVAVSYPLKVTFHKAFDLVTDPFVAMEEIIHAGCERILTSGSANDVLQGKQMLSALVERAGSRIVVMPGGGLRSSNLKEIIATGAHEFHSSALLSLPVADPTEISAMAAAIHQYR